METWGTGRETWNIECGIYNKIWKKECKTWNMRCRMSDVKNNISGRIWNMKCEMWDRMGHEARNVELEILFVIKI